MKKAAVMMSTYNGTRFLKEQIESILKQKDVEVSLFVRDDGSSDGTVELLREYENADKRIIVFAENNVGVGNSFMQLLYNVPDDYDYYAFADQDDIWLPEKLIRGISVLESSEKMLYASNQECVDKDNNSLGLRYSDEEDLHLLPEAILNENKISGCTMIFGKKLHSLLIDEDKRPSESLLRNRIHDVWVAMVASLYDGIVYDKQAFIRYRQHENNVVGAYKQSFAKRVKDKFGKLMDSEKQCGRSKLAKEIFEQHSEAAKKVAIIGICSKSRKFKNKRRIIKSYKQIKKYTGESYFAFSLKVWFNLF